MRLMPVKYTQPNPYTQRILPLVAKVPTYLQYMGFFNIILGLALLLVLAMSLPGLQRAAMLLGQSLETINQLAAKLDKFDKLDKLDQLNETAPVKPAAADFCPFPRDPGCQSSATATPVTLAEPPIAAPAEATDTPMGWIYAGKQKRQTAVKTSQRVTQGNVYTLLKSLHVRTRPASRKDRSNQRILRVVSAGEKVRVLALANRGEHLWMQIARP